MLKVYLKTLTGGSRPGLEKMLTSDPDLVIVSNGEEEFPAGGPDVVIAEVEAWDEGALDGEGVSADQGAPLIVLIDNPALAWVADALDAGVRAILPRRPTQDELLAGVRAAAAGFVVLHPDDLASIFHARAEPQEREVDPERMTPREQEVLRLMAEGLANKEIAARLSISDHTAKFHVASIMSKLGSTSRTEAVTAAIRRGHLLI